MEIYSRYRFFNGTRLVDKGFTLRDGFVSLKKTTPLRIICIGGSTTYGYYAKNSESYPKYLEQALNEYFGYRAVEVLNGGLPGKDTIFFEKYVKDKIADQQFDIVTIDCFYNDFIAFFPFLYDPLKTKVLVDDKRWRSTSVSYMWENFDIMEAINMWLVEHSYFYSRFREKLLLILHRKSTLGEIYQQRASRAKTNKRFIINKPDIKYHDTSNQEKLDGVISEFMSVYIKNMESMISTFQSNGVDVVLVMPPYPLFKYTLWKGAVNHAETSDALYREIFLKAKKLLQELAKENNLLFIDNDDYINRAGRSDDMFYDSVHLSPSGNRAVADSMAEKLGSYIHLKLR